MAGVLLLRASACLNDIVSENSAMQCVSVTKDRGNSSSRVACLKAVLGGPGLPCDDKQSPSTPYRGNHSHKPPLALQGKAYVHDLSPNFV